jgi:hypothetical protein
VVEVPRDEARRIAEEEGTSSHYYRMDAQDSAADG